MHYNVSLRSQNGYDEISLAADVDGLIRTTVETGMLVPVRMTSDGTGWSVQLMSDCACESEISSLALVRSIRYRQCS